MTVTDIDRQVAEAPLSKEEAREQFVRTTQELGLKHTLNFEEAWEAGLGLRRKQAHRDKLQEFEQRLLDSGTAITGRALTGDEDSLNPVRHLFSDGMYVREIFNPAGQLLVTKIHKQHHPFFLLAGEMSILTDEGVTHLQAPHYGITEPGTKRVIYTHTDCVFVTVHRTDSEDLNEIEQEVIAKDFSDPALALEQFELLTKDAE